MSDGASKMVVDASIVTGASGGIGRQIAVAISAASQTTHLLGRDPDRLSETAAMCEGDTERIVAEVREPESLDALAARISQRGSSRVVVVAGAGIVGPIDRPGAEDPGEWLTTIDVNLSGAYRTVQPFLPLMMQNGWGRIVMVSSAQSLHGPDPAMSAYATSKIALNAYTACLAAHFRGSNISACAIHPGDVFTQMGSEIGRKASAAGPVADHLKAWAEKTAVGGGDDPAEAGDLVMSIIEHGADWSNGRFLLVPSSVDRHPKSPWAIEVGPGY